MRTPGTNLDWHDLAGWIACARVLEGRACRASTPLKQRMEAHWEALPLEWIKTTDKATALAMLAMLGTRPHRTPWETPCRGWRAGRWADANVYTRNRLWQIARAEDQASMGAGHNSGAWA